MRFPGLGVRPPAALRLPLNAAELLFWAWALATGVALFGSWWMLRAGWWHLLIEGDPSGISIGILALAAVLTAWCGQRARRLWQESLPGSGWARAYLAERRAGVAQCAELLSERAHGPHETAWWFASAAIKLGLLGTVVGFIVMAMQIARMPGFEIEQIQALLQQMTRGMAIALYTTLAGLAANLWLGLQLMLLDRMADRLVADILQTAPAVQD